MAIDCKRPESPSRSDTFLLLGVAARLIMLIGVAVGLGRRTWCVRHGHLRFARLF